MSQHIVILGAASAIAEAAARRWAGQGARLMLAGRSEARLTSIAADLRARGAGAAEIAVLDLATADAAAQLDAMAARLGGLDVVLLAYGDLGQQAELEADPAKAAALIATNFASASAWCLAAGQRFAAARAGTLVAIGSVAGDRGRQSNYVYGATKAGLAALVQGIAHRLAPLGGRAVVIKPGFVDTPMTDGLKKGGPLWASADRVAAAIVRAAAGGGPVVYTPWFWAGIMAVVRNVPAAIFHKLRI